MARSKKPLRTQEAADKKPSKESRRIRNSAGKVARQFHAVKRLGGREYYLPMPSNRAGQFLNKRRSIIPGYFKDSFSELRQTTWPSRKETRQLTIAVFLFALVFGIIISITDYGLDKVFRKVFLK